MRKRLPLLIAGEILHRPASLFTSTVSGVGRHCDRGLMVVNAQLDKMKDPPPLLPFDVVTLDAGR